jgi:limonene 1,2-monooxygenase
MDVAVIGTPDDAIAAIERLQKQTGGFGCFMLLAHDWANSRATADSFELVARYVMPHFQQLNVNREASLEWVIRNRPQLAEQQRQALASRFAEHAARHGTENLDAAKLREFTAPPAGTRG